MRNLKKALVTDWLQSLIVWILIVYFYCLLTVFGFKAYFEENPITEYIYSQYFHFEILMTGVILGSLFMVISRVTDVPALRRRSFGFIILLKSALYIISLLFCTVLIYFVFRWLSIVTPEQFIYYQQYLFDIRYMSSILAYFFLTILLTNFVIQINKKFGPGELYNLLSGKYYHPRQEQLVVLFIDMKNSTSIAELMGNKKYSDFLKECIHEITPVLIKYQARVYQYVGDEIVLYWKLKDGNAILNCVETFFAFKEQLASRGSYFLKKFGSVPEFKAGMDAGTVTITEIGDLKREIAFHGDVLNTAARLEKKCNEFGSWLLITENVVDNAEPSEKIHFDFKSDLPLRGKQKKLRFYAASKK